MLALFPVAVFLSAALLFLLEPMFARMILPRLGGAPAVWNTCVVFYQLLLFAGYGYAHFVARRLSAKMQTLAHLGWLIAGLALLPIAVGPSWAPPTEANPIGWVFLLLLALVGLPFFALAVTGPLLQHWYGSLGHRTSANPYVLYAASNLGSLLALLAYPLLVEPSLHLHAQSLTWTALYIVLTATIVGCAVMVWRSSATAPSAAPASDVPVAAAPRGRRKPDRATEPPPDDDPWAIRLEWLALALIPSSLMLSVTTFLSTDVASVPLLWIVPLSLYLVTFILAFSERQWIPPWLLDWLFPAAVIGIVALVLAQNVFSVPATIGWHLLCFFVIALRCHQRLAAARPAPAQLTEFYLWVSGGGAVGGLFNTLVAPHIFVGALEYPLAAISACLLLPSAAPMARALWRRVVTVLSPLVPTLLLTTLLAVLSTLSRSVPDTAAARYLFVFLLPLVVCYVLRGRPRLMGLALALLLFQGTFVRFDNRVPLEIDRTFYGELRVMFTGRERLMSSGTTNHGAQSIRRDLACEPLTYYSRGGPVGQLFESFKDQPSRRRFGVIGLGTGSMAAYASPQQAWTFFEINPTVARLARNADYFTYLRDCAPQASVVLGDARLSLERVPDASFDALFVDAFSSDAIPVHLVTAEAVELYFRKLSANGLLAVHLSNRYLDLTPVIAGLARRAGLVAVAQMHEPTAQQLQISSEIAMSRWVVLARTVRDLGPLAADTRWSSLQDYDGPVWTDDYSNIVSVMRW